MFGNIGQPNLVGWSSSDNTVRTYVFDVPSNKFKAIGSRSVVIDMSRYPTASPRLAYLLSGAGVFFAFNTSGGILAQAVFNPTFGTFSQTANPNFTTNNPHVYIFSQKSNVVLCINGITTVNDALMHPYNLAFIGGHVLPVLYTGALVGDFHPNDECIFVASATGGTVFVNNGTYDTGNGIVPTFNTTGVPVTTSGSPTCCKWSPNGKYLFVGYSNGNVDSYEWDSNSQTLTYVTTFAANLGSITAIDIRFDNRFVAIGGVSGGNYLCAIYPRLGPLFQSPIRTISNMGKFLNFSGDGMLLIDSANGKCYSYSAAANNFVDDSTVLSNVPTNFFMQAVNNYIPDTSLGGYIYDVAMNDIVAGNITTMSLKLMLLDANASFNKSDTSINTVSGNGSHEVSGNGWPSNGVAITGITSAINADGFSCIQADTIEQAVDNTFSYRYAIIYDTASNNPIVFLDFGSVQQTQQQTSLTFDLSTSGIIQFRA